MVKNKALSIGDRLRRKGWISLSEARRRTGMSWSALRPHIESGEIKNMAVGRGPKPRLYISVGSLVVFLGRDMAIALGLVVDDAVAK